MVNGVNVRGALEQDTNNVGPFLLLITLDRKAKCLVYSKIIRLVRPPVQDKVPSLGENKVKSSIIHYGSLRVWNAVFLIKNR